MDEAEFETAEQAAAYQKKIMSLALSADSSALEAIAMLCSYDRKVQPFSLAEFMKGCDDEARNNNSAALVIDG
jgi:hypothetical protein